METKYTQGPWVEISRHYPTDPKKVITGIGVEVEPNYFQIIVNTVLPNTDEEYLKDREEIEANARLISSAPELLEALLIAKNLLELPYNSATENEIDQINDAINKATGVSN